ncbi:hypothetical protein ABIA39_003324 [Nocardia sp. GAS34]
MPGQTDGEARDAAEHHPPDPDDEYRDPGQRSRQASIFSSSEKL